MKEHIWQSCHCIQEQRCKTGLMHRDQRPCQHPGSPDFLFLPAAYPLSLKSRIWAMMRKTFGLKYAWIQTVIPHFQSHKTFPMENLFPSRQDLLIRIKHKTAYRFIHDITYRLAYHFQTSFKKNVEKQRNPRAEKLSKYSSKGRLGMMLL